MPNERAYAQILHTIRLIPAGNVASYGQIADLAGLPGRARMVGRCLRESSPVPPVPWHRVLRADGKLAFPPGSDSYQQQRTRLVEEGVTVMNHRVPLKEFGWSPDLYTLMHEIPY